MQILLRAPRATYRVQLHAGFNFEDAAGIAGYLADLGVSHVYCSPYLQAAPGSMHGYDVVDHTRLSEELGGAPAHEGFCKALGEVGLAQLVDIVPNHMSIEGTHNKWWWDVLRNGPSSRYARFFDIDWDVLGGKVLLPILGQPLRAAVAGGEIVIERQDDAFVARYYEHAFPLEERSAQELDDDPALVDRLNSDAASLLELLARQHYVLAFWRHGDRDLNYRRFFDIKTLIALRVEDPDVFEAVHRLVFDLVREGKIDGLRIDHIDGLTAPRAYLERLREHVGDRYIVVEKILERGEELRRSWPVQGSTGYEFAARATGLFVDPGSEQTMTEIYAAFTGQHEDLAELTHASKRLALRALLAPDVARLTRSFDAVCRRAPLHRDRRPEELHDAVTEMLAALPVYRTYVEPESGAVSAEDVRYVREATQRARERRLDLDPELFDFLEELLLGSDRSPAGVELVTLFQQTSGPAMAKGFEDTLLYRYNRLVALNEVGADPGSFGNSIEEFHRLNAAVQERWPLSLLATSTHDTKRSEDVRARISLLSEIPDAWSDAVHRWAERNAPHRRGPFPDRNAEYLLYQTLVGAWPISTERMLQYMSKAAKEAKSHTSWVDPNQEYEEALSAFVRAALADAEFTRDLQAFVAPLVEPGRITSLAQVLLKLVSPGVPDIYQGSELWELSLVDPDNRRPVDYATRSELLDDIKDASAAEVWERIDEGAPKLWLIHKALALRAQQPEAFSGSYEPLFATGPRAHHAVALVRGGTVMAIAPRLVIGLDGDWKDTTVGLPPGRWHDVLTGETYPGGDTELARILEAFPVALLARA